MFSYIANVAFLVGVVLIVVCQADPCFQVQDRLPPSCSCSNSYLTCTKIMDTETLLQATRAFRGTNSVLQDFNIHNFDLPYLPMGLFEGVDVQNINFHGGKLGQLKDPSADRDKTFFDGLKSTGRISLATVKIGSSSAEGWEYFFRKHFDSVHYLRITGMDLGLKILPKNFAVSLSSSMAIIRIVGTTLNKLESRSLSCLSCTNYQLQSNAISQIAQDAFWGSENLVDLQLDNNKLETLADGLFDNMGNLEYLRLNNNPLRHLSEKSFSQVPTSAAVLLSGDEFDCQCSLKWLLNFNPEKSILGSCDLNSGRIIELQKYLHSCPLLV